MDKNLIESIDHIVLTTKEIKNCKYFYCNFLRFELIEFTDENETRYSFKFGQQKINIHFLEKPYYPHALNVILALKMSVLLPKWIFNCGLEGAKILI